MLSESSRGADDARWWRLEPRAGETLRSALERTLREAIVGGALREGVRLPSSRTLAGELGVSRGVVSDAYARLEAQGLLILKARSVPAVASVRPSAASNLEWDPAAPRYRYDLTPTTPDVVLFPLKKWLAAAQRVAREAGPAAFDYRHPRGERVLRQVLADYLGRTRGIVADPEQILVTQGTSQSLHLLLRVLSRRGATEITVEDPSHPGQSERIRSAGFTPRAQPVDDAGLVVDGLAGETVLVTPAHQFPLGSVLSDERRQQLLAWAGEGDRLILEDDYDAEFRYDGEPERALQGLAPSKVVHLGSVSKTLAPALRLGWIVAPPALVDALESERYLLDGFSPLIDQLTLAELIRSGDYSRHVRRARGIYRNRRDRLHAALTSKIPDCEVTGAEAGMHLVLRMPADADDAAVSRKAAEARIRVFELSWFCLERRDARGLVVGFGRLHESAVEPATQLLATVLHRR